MRRRIILSITLLLCVVFLAGCKTTLVVHDVTVAQIIPVFKDYAGIHGYLFSYQNDQTGAYGLNLGDVYVADTSQTTKTRTVYVEPPPKDSNIPLTSREETTWQTVSNPGHYVEATATVSILQQGKDVLVLIETNEVGGSSLGDLDDYLHSLGYNVESK